MEFNRGLLYHVESLEQDDTYGDYIIGRIPEAVRRQLNPKAQSNMLFVSNSELRFVMEEDAVTIVLRRLPVSGQIKSRGILEVFSGDYQGSCEISPEVIDVNETEITIRRQDWSHICRFPRNPGGFPAAQTGRNAGEAPAVLRFIHHPRRQRFRSIEDICVSDGVGAGIRFHQSGKCRQRIYGLCDGRIYCRPDRLGCRRV